MKVFINQVHPFDWTPDDSRTGKPVQYLVVTYTRLASKTDSNDFGALSSEARAPFSQDEMFRQSLRDGKRIFDIELDTRTTTNRDTGQSKTHLVIAEATPCADQTFPKLEVPVYVPPVVTRPAAPAPAAPAADRGGNNFAARPAGNGNNGMNTSFPQRAPVGAGS